MNNQKNISSIFHSFLLSIVLLAPFYNLIKNSSYRIHIITGLLVIITILMQLYIKRMQARMKSNKNLKNRFSKLLEKRRSQAISGHRESSHTKKRLKELQSLVESNLITEEEYQRKRSEILKEL